MIIGAHEELVMLSNPAMEEPEPNQMTDKDGIDLSDVRQSGKTYW
jgi:hypothetical protein